MKKKEKEIETDQVEETVVTSWKPERDEQSTDNPVYNPEKFKVEEERKEEIGDWSGGRNQRRQDENLRVMAT